MSEQPTKTQKMLLTQNEVYNKFMFMLAVFCGYLKYRLQN